MLPSVSSVVLLFTVLAVKTAGQIVSISESGGEAPCVFPFFYQSQPKTNCISDNYCAPWCGTTANYDQDRAWGVCVIDKPGGAIGTFGGNSDCNDCVFPFTYDGLSRSGCIMEDSTGRPWCGTTNNYPTDRRWGYCILRQTTTSSTTDSGTPTTSTTTTTTTTTTTATTTDPNKSTASTPCTTLECLTGGSDVTRIHLAVIYLCFIVCIVLYI